MENLSILFFSYFLIITSTVGYGYLYSIIFLPNVKSINLGFIGLYGIFFCIFISYFTNYFLPHDMLFNSMVLLTGIICFGVLIIKNYKIILKKELKLLFIIFTILFVALMISKNHDDFPYYHFEYTYILTQFDLLIGLGQFNHGFKTPSSIFYLNSLYYLPYIQFYSFNIGTLIIMGFVNFTLLKKINFEDFSKNSSLISVYSLLCFIFINIFFYRISEHGTDRTAQILVLLLISELMYFKLKSRSNNFEIHNIYLILVLIISLKSFYILYTLFLIPLYFQILKEESFNNFIRIVFLKRYILIFGLTLLFSFLTYFYSTGCFIFPVSYSCISNLSWALELNQVETMYLHYEKWAKGVTGVGYTTLNANLLVNGLNWVPNWIDRYFFNKVSDFILSLFFLCCLLSYIFFKFSFSKQKLKVNYIHYIILFILVILLLEWFINHPSLRYGGYNLFALLFLLPTSILISSYKIHAIKSFKIVIILILLTTAIFLSRNFVRLHKENNHYDYNPFQNVFYKVDETHFNEFNDINKVIDNYSTNNDKVKKLFNKFVFLK